MMTEAEIIALVNIDINNAEPYQDELNEQRDDWIETYDAKKLGNESKDKSKSKYISRDVKRSAEWQRSSLIDPFVSSPRPIKTYPVSASDAGIADQSQSTLNYHFTRGFNRYTFMSDSVKIFQREGTVVARVSWKFEEREVEVDEPILAMLPDGTQIPVGSRRVKKMRTIINRPWAEAIDNRNISIDPTAKNNIMNAQFVVHDFKKNLSELKEDGRYRNLDKVEKKEIKMNGSDYGKTKTYGDDSQKKQFVFSDIERRELDVKEYWGYLDINQDGLTEPITITMIGDTLIHVGENPFPDGFIPFVSLANNSEPFSVTGEANAETLKDGQILKSGAIRGVIDNMVNSTNGQTGIKKSALDPVNRRKFEAGKNFQFNTNPGDIWQGSYNQIPSSLFDFYNIISSEMEASAGVRPFNQSGAGSATESRNQMSASDIRELDLVRNIRENYVKPIMRMWMEMSNEFMEPEDFEAITEKPYVPCNPDDLMGLIDLCLKFIHLKLFHLLLIRVWFRLILFNELSHVSHTIKLIHLSSHLHCHFWWDMLHCSLEDKRDSLCFLCIHSSRRDLKVNIDET